MSLGCRVTVVDRSGRSRRDAAAGAAVVESISELPDVDGVVVAVPTVAHARVVEDLLPRGVPIFVEKPLTADPAAARRLAEAAPDRLFVMDKWRYHPGIERLAEIARSGELGPVLGLRTTRVDWGNPHDDVDAVWILLPHDLAIALEVLGHVPAARSASAIARGNEAWVMVALLGTEPSVVAEVSALTPRRRRAVVLHCLQGVAVLDDAYDDHIQVWPGAAGQPRPPAPEKRSISNEMPLLRELRAFVDHLAGGPPPRSSAAEGAMIVSRISELRRLAGLDRPS